MTNKEALFPKVKAGQDSTSVDMASAETASQE